MEGPLQNFVLYADRKSKMATTAIHRLTLSPMGKCSNAFFSETTNMIKAKLYMNGSQKDKCLKRLNRENNLQPFCQEYCIDEGLETKMTRSVLRICC